MKSPIFAMAIALLFATGTVAAQQKPASQPAASQATDRPAPGAIEPGAVRDAGLRVAMAVGAVVALLAALVRPNPLVLALVLGGVLSALWFFAVSRFLRADAWMEVERSAP